MRCNVVPMSEEVKQAIAHLCTVSGADVEKVVTAYANGSITEKQICDAMRFYGKIWHRHYGIWVDGVPEWLARLR